MHFIWLLRPSAADKNVSGHIYKALPSVSLPGQFKSAQNFLDQISSWQGFQDEVSIFCPAAGTTLVQRSND